MASTICEFQPDSELDPRAARQKLESAATLHWFHWLIVCGSLVVTFFAWYYSKSQIESRISAQFDREADQVVELVLERMRKYEDALWSGVALIHTSGGDVDFDRWEQYAERIHIEETYPGINGIGVIHAVSHDGLDVYLAAQKRRRPEFGIHPARRGELYLPISYIIPVVGNERAVGLDMAHETNRLTAAIKARDTGLAQITGPITLVQDSAKQPGFLFYAPFYNEALQSTDANRQKDFAGMVYAPFVMRKLMEGTLEKDKRHVGIRIFDGIDELYDEHTSEEQDFDPHPLFTRSVDVKLYGRTWKFDIWSAKSFREAASDHQPLTILIGGLVVDSLLVFLFISISRSSHRALMYADSMTHQLEDNAKVLEAKAEELETSNAELSRFNKSARGRELRMVELKQEVNDLLAAAGEPVRYDVDFLDD